MRSRGPLLIAAALAALLAWRFWPRAPAPPPNLLLITLDTTRADAVGRVTPAIEAFLASSTRFASARTTVPLTLPAHVSLLSGLEPKSHGIHENLVPRIPLDRGYTFLQEELLAAGYRTAAFVASPVLGVPTGIGAGFLTFEAPGRTEDSWSGEQGDVPAEERILAPLTWLAASDPRPWFLWVHFYDPHVPYLPYAAADTHEGDPAKALYAGEVQRMDAAVKRLLAAAGERTIVVLVSDHGEGLGEHGEDTHGTLCYGSTGDLVLLVRAPTLEAGTTDERLRSICDLAPTLRGWCGLPAQASDGVAMAGTGDVRILEDAKMMRVVVTESLLAYRMYGWGQVFAATDGRFSLVESGPRLDLFDLAADPLETRPIRPEGHPAYEALDRGMTAYRESKAREPQGPYTAGSPYGHAVRPFSSYLPRAENAALKDPETGFGFTARMATAKSLMHVGKERRDAAALEKSIAILLKLAEEDPKNPAPHLYLAHARARLAWVLGKSELHREAARSARTAIELGYRVAPLLHDLLTESLEAGELIDLRTALEVALKEPIHPDLKCAELAARIGLKLSEAGDGEGANMAREFLERCRRLGIGPPPPSK